jgi:hypothetical protein
MKRWFLITMLLTLSLATLAEAGSFVTEERTGRWDFTIQTRYSWSQDITNDDGSSVALDDDLGWGFGFNKYLSEKANVGLKFAWHSTYYTATGVSEDDPQDIASYTNVLSTSAIAIEGNYFLTESRIKPYVSGNLGWMWANTNITADIDGGCWYYPYVGYVCSGYPASTYGTDSFTYGLGLGLQVDLSPTAFLRVGWDHSWVDMDSYDGNDVLRVDIGWLL